MPNQIAAPTRPIALPLQSHALLAGVAERVKILAHAPMKTTILILVLILGGVLVKAGTNEVFTFRISAEDVVQSSIYKGRSSVSRDGTNNLSVKFQYTETGSNRARAFTAAHQNKMVRDSIGEFTTWPSLLRLTNTSGRSGYHGISEKDANAIVDALSRK